MRINTSDDVGKLFATMAQLLARYATGAKALGLPMPRTKAGLEYRPIPATDPDFDLVPFSSDGLEQLLQDICDLGDVCIDQVGKLATCHKEALRLLRELGSI